MTAALTDPRLAALIDPREAAFANPNDIANLDPDLVFPKIWADMPNEGQQYKTLTDVSIGLGVAFLVLNRLVGKNLSSYGGVGTSSLGAPILAAASSSVDRVTNKYRKAWQHMVNPAFRTTMALGTTGGMSYSDEIEYASIFSNQLYDYINETSAETMIAAYSNQLAQKWHPDVAWMRAVGGYGLEPRSMTQYIKMLGTGEADRVVPEVATRFVQKSLHERAERIGANESQRAVEMGKTLAWMRQHREGRLPTDAQREWLTAEDERVCKICGPMDRKKVDMQSKFTLPDGNEVWAPGVHPNCRCAVRLAYPVLTLVKAEFDPDEHPRGGDGRFVETLEEQAITAPIRSGVTAPVTAPITAPVRAPVAAPVTAPVRAPIAAPVVAPVTAPVRAPLLNLPQIRIPQPVQARPRNFQRPPVPHYAFANDYELQTGRGSWKGDSDYHAGQVIDMDKLGEPTKAGESRFALRTDPLFSEWTLARRASDNYGDEARWDHWDRAERNAYLRTAKVFYDSATIQSEQIINNRELMTDYDIHEIFKLGGKADVAAQASPSELREDLIHGVAGQSPLRDAYLHYVEQHKPRAVGGSLGEEMQAYQRNMADTDLNPHITNVFVFDRGFSGGFVPGDYHGDERQVVGLVEGKYRVYKTQVAPLKVTTGGSDIPSNITAINYVYLEPI